MLMDTFILQWETFLTHVMSGFPEYQYSNRTDKAVDYTVNALVDD